MQTLRLAGYNERRCIARDTLGLYGCITAIGTYSVSAAPSQAKDLENCLAMALKACILQHPALSIIVQDAMSEAPQLAQVTTIELSNHLRLLPPVDPGINSDTALENLIHTVQNENLTAYGSRPQWRLYVQKMASTTATACYNVAFACSHALADGMSLATFHTTFLQALQSGYKGEYSGTQVAPASDLLPALDKAAVFPITWLFFGGVLLGEIIPSQVARMVGIESRDGVWHGAAQRPRLPLVQSAEQLLPTAVKLIIIPRKILEQVLLTCKRHEARLTGLLNQLIARALAHALRIRGHEYTRYACETPFDLRRCIPEARGHMANYASAVSDIIDLSDAEDETLVSDTDWKAAQRMTNHLAASSSTLSNQLVQLLRYVGKIRPWVSQKAAKPADTSFSLSNLGVLSLASAVSDLETATKDTPSWELKEMLFSQSADACGSPLNINAASAKGGSLAVTVTWWPGMLGVGIDEEAGLVKDMLLNLRAGLDNIASNQ